jgi:hypothetical protein
MAKNNVCNTLGALQNAGTRALQKALGKAAIMSRLAGLIERAGALSPIPNIPGLIPLKDLSAQNYEDLRRACPFLGLAPFSGGGLDELKRKVDEAYAQLTNELANHPWSRFDGLQGPLDNAVNQASSYANQALGTLAGLARCVEGLCAAGGALGGLGKPGGGSIEDQWDAYKKDQANFGKALTESQRDKQRQLDEAKSLLRELRTDPGFDRLND